MITKDRLNRFFFDRKGWIPIFFLLVFILCIIVAPNITSILLASLFVAYAIEPLVKFMSRKLRLPRSVASGLVLFIIVLFGLLLILIVLPGIIEQLYMAFRNFDAFSKDLWEWINAVSLKLGIDLSSHIDRNELAGRLSTVFEPVIKSVSNLFGLLFKKTFGVLTFIFNFIIFVVIAYFSSSRFPQISESIFSLVPPKKQISAKEWLAKFDRILSGFIRGQLLVCLVLGSLYSGGFAVANIPNALSMGIIIGSLCIVPYVGLFIGIVISVLLTLVSAGPLALIKLAIVFIVIQTCDTLFITPNIVGKKVGIRPVFVIIAIFAGAEIGGFLGVLIAVPTFAILKLLGDDMIKRYKYSSFYTENEEVES
jgi:putative permease